MPAPTYEGILAGQVAESGAPLHPWWQDALDPHWLDATVADYTRTDGAVISARERSLMGASLYYAMERLRGALTPLGMIAEAEAMLTFLTLAATPEYADADVWGDSSRIPAAAVDEFQRAEWHVQQAIDLMGIDRETGQRKEGGDEPATEG